MLLRLTEWLAQYWSGFHVFQYLTLRGILAALTALSIALLVGPWMIRALAARQIGQNVRELGPQTHLKKQGTPTMGGTLILVAMLGSTLLWADLANRYVWIVVGTTLAFGLVGFYDDYLKLVVGNSKGLPARHKYLLQSVAGLGAAIALYLSAQTPAETALHVPLLKNVVIPLGGVGFGLALYHHAFGHADGRFLVLGVKPHDKVAALDALALLDREAFDDAHDACGQGDPLFRVGMTRNPDRACMGDARRRDNGNGPQRRLRRLHSFRSRRRGLVLGAANG